MTAYAARHARLPWPGDHRTRAPRRVSAARWHWHAALHRLRTLVPRRPALRRATATLTDMTIVVRHPEYASVPQAAIGGGRPYARKEGYR